MCVIKVCIYYISSFDQARSRTLEIEGEGDHWISSRLRHAARVVCSQTICRVSHPCPFWICCIRTEFLRYRICSSVGELPNCTPLVRILFLWTSAFSFCSRRKLAPIRSLHKGFRALLFRSSVLRDIYLLTNVLERYLLLEYQLYSSKSIRNREMARRVGLQICRDTTIIYSISNFMHRFTHGQ